MPQSGRVRDLSYVISFDTDIKCVLIRGISQPRGNIHIDAYETHEISDVSPEIISLVSRIIDVDDSQIREILNCISTHYQV